MQEVGLKANDESTHIFMREIEFYFTPAKPGCGHMTIASEGGMWLRLRGESTVQARRSSIYLCTFIYAGTKTCPDR